MASAANSIFYKMESTAKTVSCMIECVTAIMLYKRFVSKTVYACCGVMCFNIKSVQNIIYDRQYGICNKYRVNRQYR
jgi:hypothetical protein